MVAFRRVHTLLVVPVEASIPSAESSRDATSVHGSVRAAVMDDSMEHPHVFSVEVVEVVSIEASTEAFTEAFTESTSTETCGEVI